MSPGHLGSTSNASQGQGQGQGQQFPIHGRENMNQLPPRQPTNNGIGSGVSSMPPPQSPANMSLGPDHLLQLQHARQQMNRSSPQPPAASANGVGLENPLTSQKQQTPQGQPHPGFTKQQLHVLKAQILAFRRIKVCRTCFFFLNIFFIYHLRGYFFPT